VTTALREDLLELAAVPAPTFAEESRLAWLERRLAGEAGERTRDGAGNLVWRFGVGPVRLLLLAHVDTVFAADTPLRFERQGTRLVGPGIGDNAAAVVALVHALSSLAEHECPLDGVVAAFTVGEEGLGNLRGAYEACERLRPATVIAVEGHGLERVIVDAVGSVRVRLHVSGPGGHSWEDRGAPSAVHALLGLGARILGSTSPDAPVNIGLVNGGRSVNAIADTAELTVERRSLDENDLQRFREELEKLSVEPPLVIGRDVLGRRPAGRLDRSSPVLAAVRRVRGRLGLPDAIGAGSTDANAALACGIPALTLGVARGGLMHTDAEWVEEETLQTGLRQLEDVVAAIAEVP
jgi:tripeptide aminopeptidase